MKILYVTDYFSSLKKIIEEDAIGPTGSPALFNPLIKLIEKGHNVDIVVPIFSKNIRNISTKSSLIKANIDLYYYNKRIYSRILSDIRLLIYLRNKMRKNSYDFVYGHGSFGAYGTIVAKALKIPCGARLYGSFLYFRLRGKSKYLIAVRYYRQYLPFVTKKNFLIITNDGTHGDEIYSRISVKKKFDFYFMLNGVDKKYFAKEIVKEKKLERVLLYVARVEEWKNQIFAIKVLKEAIDLGESEFEMHIAGTIYNRKYWEKVLEYIESNDLAEKCKYLGVLNRTDLRKYYQSCFAVLSFYEYSNLSNICLEAMASGSLFVTINDRSTSGIIENSKNGILIDTPREAAEKLICLKNNPVLYQRIKNRARTSGEIKILSWAERAQIEVDIIEKAANK